MRSFYRHGRRVATYPVGQYVCVDTPGWAPWLIKIGTLSRYDHVFVIVSPDGDIVEAEPGGARKAHISKYAGRRMIRSNDTMDSTATNTIVKNALSMVGVPYNDLAILDDGLESLGLFWSWLANLADGDHEVICSQLVALCGQAAGLDWLCGRKHASEVTPANLARRTGMIALTVGG